MKKFFKAVLLKLKRGKRGEISPTRHLFIVILPTGIQTAQALHILQGTKYFLRIFP
jgi:hypothetical protein